MASSGAVKHGPIETRLFINGEFRESSDGKKFKVVNPATKEVAAEVFEATVEDTDAAVAAAKKAFPEWSAKSPGERGALIEKWADLVLDNVPELAYLEAVSMGIPMHQFFGAHAGVERAKLIAGLGWQAHGKTSLNTPGIIGLTFRQPYGVVAAIIPWNVPVLFFLWKCAAALVTGNTVVLKSSEKAPLTSLKLAELSAKAGFPAGVLNVLSGYGNPCGAALSAHMDVRALSFTGSGRTGRLIQQAAAKSNLKAVTLELGGKSPAVVFDDADLEQAVPDLLQSITMLSGQACVASSRVYVQDTIAEKFIAKYKDLFKNLQPGDPMDPKALRGPQVDEAQFNNIKRYIEMGKKAGKLEIGDEPADSKGYYISSTVFSGLPEDSQPMQEEIFGPVVNINTFKTEEEVLRKANNTEYGLYASVYTKDIDRAMRFAKGFESGAVGVNCTSPTMSLDLPFGGYKASGQGREGLVESIDHFLETKTVVVKIA